MIVEVKTETVPLTLEIAKHYRRMLALRGDRDVDSCAGRKRVDKLRQMNLAGQFHSPIWSAVIVTGEKGKKFRIDGAHSTMMLVESGADFPKDLSVTIRTFRAATIEEAVRLWELFNPKISMRSLGDIAIGRAAYISGLCNIKSGKLLMAARGVALHYKLHDPNMARDPLDYLSMHPAFIADVQEFLGTPMLAKSAVVATMFSTWGRSDGNSPKFWRRVRDESASDPKCPTRVLAKYLTEQKSKAKAGGVADTGFILYVKCHHAWNAWRTNRITNLKFIKGCPVPIAK